MVLVETSVDFTVPHTPAPEFVGVATFIHQDIPGLQQTGGGLALRNKHGRNFR
jgi:hypothetical protein